MDLPINIKTKIEELSNQYRTSELKKSASKISNAYLNNVGSDEHLINSEIDVLVYAITRMPATYASVYSVLKQTFDIYRDPIHSVLDIGAGVGTASLAISSFLSSNTKYMAIEREKEMIKLGKFLTEDININWIEKDYLKEEIKVTADLVIASYTLNEISENKREEIVKHLLDITNKLLIIIEPGTPLAFSQIKKYRELALNESCYIVAPCPNCDKCHVLENDWCHFSTRVARSKLHRYLKEGEAAFEDEKYSYIVISKTPVLKEDFHRVMRHPIIKGNGVQLTTCSKDGIQSFEVTKKNKENYKIARKVNCGDKIKLDD